MAVLLYRIEDAVNHEGPFGTTQWAMPGELRERMHKMPSPRPWWKPNEAHLFACESLHGLARLFCEETRTWLAKNGFVLAIYEAEEQYMQRCPEGHQCSFDREIAKRTEERPIYEITGESHGQAN